MQKDYDNAIKYSLIAHSKGHATASCNIGHYYECIGNYEEAEQYYSIAFGENNYNACSFLGDLYIKQNKRENSMHYYLLGYENKCPESMLGLGNHYYDAKQFDIAEKYYLEALLYDKFYAYYQLGCICEKQNKFKQAEKYFVLAQEKNISEASKKLEQFKNKTVTKQNDIPLSATQIAVPQTKPNETKNLMQNLMKTLTSLFQRKAELNEEEYELLGTKSHEE